MMASSQVEFASSSPFGYVAAVIHSRGGRYYQKKLDTCTPTGNSSHENLDYTNLWVHRPVHPHWQPPNPNNNSNHDIDDDDDDSDDDDDDDKNNTDDSIDSLRAREIVVSVDNRSKDAGLISPTLSDGSGEIPNSGGVSSLVQKWKGFEAVAKSPGRASSCPDTAPPVAANEDDVFDDWKSDRTVPSGPSSRGRDSDVTENERVRVSDIIKKLTEEPVCEPTSLPRVRISSNQSEQQRCFTPAVKSPRIRGRQAFNNILIQMERERHTELEGLVARRAVSKFSQRGRIQALLRFKFLRRGIEANEVRHSMGVSADRSHGLRQPAVVHFRERVKSSVQNGSVHSGSSRKRLIDNTPVVAESKENQDQEVSQAKSSDKVNTDHVQDKEGAITSSGHDVYHSSPKVDKNLKQKKIQSHNFENLHHEGSPFSAFMWQETTRETTDNSMVEFTETSKALSFIGTNVFLKEEVATNRQVVVTNYDLKSESADQHCFKGVANNQCSVENSPYWVNDVCHAEDEWEELQSDDQQQERNNTDWIYEVSRPRSDWEGLRQARYQEMLDPFRQKEDICALLGRKSVSTFLSSGLRHQIDKVMLCRTQGQQIPTNSNTRDEEQAQVYEEGVRVGGNEIVALEEQGEDGDNEHGEERENFNDYYDEYEEDESSIGHQCNESNGYININSPPPSWPQNHGREASCYSSQVASPSPRQSMSIEMDIIYDLRRHMEQLHREMSELKKSIKCCMNMQCKLHYSVKHEVATTLNNSDERKDQGHKSGGKCFVCCLELVDSLLYRCGHMCTCYKCAHELQGSSGKCPICKAPIMDVVRISYNIPE